MQKAISTLGLVGLASASLEQGYGSSLEGYGATSSLVAYLSSSAVGSYPYSSLAAYPSSVVPSMTSSAAPQPSGECDECTDQDGSQPGCWVSCFADAGIKNADELCSNGDVSRCIHDNCSEAEDEKYREWLVTYCYPASSSVGPSHISSVAASSAPYSYVSSSAHGSYIPSSAPAGYGSSSALAGYGSSLSSYASPEISSAYPSYPGVDSSSKAIPHSSGSGVSSVYYPYPSSTGHSSEAAVPSNSLSSSETRSASSTIPSATTDCSEQCFAAAGVQSKDELCGNSAVSQCIHDTCTSDEDRKYWQWYESFCPAGSETSSIEVSPSTFSSSIQYASSTKILSSEVSGVPTSSGIVPTQTADCWGVCFAAAGIQSKDELCRNTAVGQCIHDTCSSAEDNKYWQWYESFCPPESTIPSVPLSSKASGVPGTYSVTSGVVTSPTTASTATPTPSEDNCWSQCFTQCNIETEAALCGNDEVSRCINNSCSADMDRAYWDWYNGFCSPSTTTFMTTEVQTSTYSATTEATQDAPTATSYGGNVSGTTTIETTYMVTTKCPSTPKESSPATTGLPKPPPETKEAPAPTPSDHAVESSPVLASSPAENQSPPPSPANYPAKTSVAMPESPEFTTVASEAYPVAPLPSSPADSQAPPPAPESYPAEVSEASPAAPWTSEAARVAPSGYGVAQPTGTYPNASISSWVPVPATGAGATNKPVTIVGIALAFAALF